MSDNKYVPLTHNISRKPTRVVPGAPLWVQRAQAGTLPAQDRTGAVKA